MFFPRLFTTVLLSLAVLASAAPAPESEALANRQFDNQWGPHPGQGGHPPHPSASARGDKHWPKKRAPLPSNLPLGAAVDLARCPAGLIACPVTPMTSQEVLAAENGGSYECVSPEEDLYSCGGCATLGTGLDCTAISSVNSVSCVRGTCQIHSCKEGFETTATGEACSPVLRKRSRL